MHSYISYFENHLLIIKQNEIIAYNLLSEQTLNYIHSEEFSYIKENFVVDIKKNLFQILITEFIQIKQITPLKKSISTLKIHNNDIYICDRFGDVYKIQDKPKFILGNLCFTSSMVLNEKIWTGDKYGRIRISHHDGKIESYLFLDDFPIYEMVLLREKIYISTKNKLIILKTNTLEIQNLDIPMILKMVKSKDNLYCLTKDKIYIINTNDEISENQLEEKYIDGICHLDDFYTLSENGKVFRNKQRILDLSATFKTHYDLINF